jgi:Zn-dependent protease with chaperone function
MNRLRRAGVATAAALIALTSVQPGLAASSDKFSVSGKKGPFIKAVAVRHLDQTGGGGGALGLASDALNQGDYQAARLRMPQTEAKIKALLDRIETNWPYDKSHPVQVHIVGIDYYSAYSLPDGSIMVGLGLLERAQSDDEVAFVLAHELGHIRLGHFAQNAGKAVETEKNASRLGQLFMIGAAVHGGMTRGGGVGSVNSVLDQAGRQADATSDYLHFLAAAMVEPSHSRVQEDEADALGFDLSQATGYSAEGASARVFDTIQADQDTRKTTHDQLSAQLKNQLGKTVSDTAAQTFLSGGTPSSGSVTHSLLAGAGRLALAAAAGGQSDSGPRHRTPEARKQGIANYSSDAYPNGLPLHDEQSGWLSEVKSTKEYKEGAITVAAVRAAMKARAAADFAGAEAQIAPAMKTQFANAPLVINEAARIRDDMHDLPRADALFTRADQSPDQTVDGFLDHSRMFYRVSQSDRAMAVLQQGISRFGGDQKPFISLEIAVAKQSGQRGQALSFLNQCLTYPDPDLKKDCQDAAGDLAGDARGGQQTQEQPKPKIHVHIPGMPF